MRYLIDLDSELNYADNEHALVAGTSTMPLDLLQQLGENVSMELQLRGGDDESPWTTEPTVEILAVETLTPTQARFRALAALKTMAHGLDTCALNACVVLADHDYDKQSTFINQQLARLTTEALDPDDRVSAARELLCLTTP